MSHRLLLRVPKAIVAIPVGILAAPVVTVGFSFQVADELYFGRRQRDPFDSATFPFFCITALIMIGVSPVIGALGAPSMVMFGDL